MLSCLQHTSQEAPTWNYNPEKSITYPELHVFIILGSFITLLVMLSYLQA